MKYDLLTPIKDLRKQTISSLEVRSVQTVADVLYVNSEGKDAFERSVHTVARLTGLDYKAEASQLDMRDLLKLIELINQLSIDPRDPKPEESLPKGSSASTIE